jgi:hypothetical protein
MPDYWKDKNDYKHYLFLFTQRRIYFRKMFDNFYPLFPIIKEHPVNTNNQDADR